MRITKVIGAFPTICDTDREEIGMDDAEREYCRRRADEERRQAVDSVAPEIAKIHTEMARLFDLRARDPAAWDMLTARFFT